MSIDKYVKIPKKDKKEIEESTVVLKSDRRLSDERKVELNKKLGDVIRIVESAKDEEITDYLTNAQHKMRMKDIETVHREIKSDLHSSYSDAAFRTLSSKSDGFMKDHQFNNREIIKYMSESYELDINPNDSYILDEILDTAIKTSTY